MNKFGDEQSEIVKWINSIINDKVVRYSGKDNEPFDDGLLVL
jgi:hypothetical protein